MKYPLFKVHVDVESAVEEIRKVLASGYINEGEKVEEFRSELCNFFETKNVVLTNSCTSSLTMALKASGVSNDDEVITTAMTCVATNMPVIQLGAVPIWADIDRNTGNISPDHVRRLISEKTKAIMCVNWAGLPCDMDELSRICKENNLKLILDAAHSLGARYNGKDVSNFADFTCYSFQAIKHITTGDGGAIIVKSSKDLSKVKKLKWFGMDRDETKNSKGDWKGQRWEFDIDSIGYKFNMNNFAAALGLSQVSHIERILSSHRKNAEVYERRFRNLDAIQSLRYPKDSIPSFWVYTCLLDKDVNRDSVLEALNDEGIQAGLVHIPNHRYTCFKDSEKDLPETEYFHSHQISLPCGWWLKEEDVEHIASRVASLCKEKK